MQLIEITKSGQGQVTLLSGEAGVGKSRLVKEAKAYATPSMCILQGICFESDQSYPYAPLLDLLRTCFNTLAPEDFLQHSDAIPHELIKLLPELDNGQLNVRMMSGDDPQQEKRQLFAALTQFFIEEILKSLIASEVLVCTNGKWVGRPLHELHIPRNIQDAVQQRIEGLSEAAKQILTLASVTGDRFDFALLQQLTHDDEQQLLTVMKELIAAQLVVEESADQFAFRHALTRQAIYVELLTRERKGLHLKIAKTIESMHTATLEPYLEDLAYHYYKAEVWDKAFHYGQLAGEKAQALYAPRAAIEQFTQALHAAQHLTILPSITLNNWRGRSMIRS